MAGRDGARPGRRHRRGRRRHVGRVPPRGAGLDRRRAAGSRGADVWLDVPQRRARRAAAEHRDADADDDVRRRAVPAAGGRDRRRSLVARGRVPATGVEPGPLRGAPAPGGLGGELRAADRARVGHRRAGPVPVDDHRRRAGRGLAPDRRLARPVEPRVRARGGRAQARRAGAAAPSRERHRHSRRAGDRRGSAARRRAVRHRGGGRRQRGRHVRARHRPDGGDHAADHPDGPPVPADGTDRGRRAGPAAAARSRQPRLLPRGGRRPVHGRLRARSEAVGARRDPARLQPSPPRPGLAAVRGDHGRRHPPGPRHRRRPRDADDQRAGGLHARQRVHPRRVGRARACSWRPGSARTASRAPGASAARSASWIVDGEPELDLWKMDIRRFGAQYRSRSYTLARTLRELRDVLRHPLPERGAPGRPAAPRLPGLRAARGARRRLRGEVVVGAGELVRAERGRSRRGRRRGARGAPAARLGRRALEPGDRGGGARDAHDGRRCSTRRRSRRSSSSVRARRRCCSGCAPTTSTARSAASRTPSCSTGEAASSATSRSRGSRPTASCS